MDTTDLIDITRQRIDIENSADCIFDAEEDLETVQGLNLALDQEDIPEVDKEILTHAIETICLSRRLIRPSQKTSVATETIGEAISNIIQAIKRVLRKILEWCMNTVKALYGFFTRKKANVEKVDQIVKKTKDQVKQAQKDPETKAVHEKVSNVLTSEIKNDIVADEFLKVLMAAVDQMVPNKPNDTELKLRVISSAKYQHMRYNNQIVSGMDLLVLFHEMSGTFNTIRSQFLNKSTYEKNFKLALSGFEAAQKGPSGKPDLENLAIDLDIPRIHGKQSKGAYFGGVQLYQIDGENILGDAHLMTYGPQNPNPKEVLKTLSQWKLALVLPDTEVPIDTAMKCLTMDQIDDLNSALKKMAEAGEKDKDLIEKISSDLKELDNRLETWSSQNSEDGNTVSTNLYNKVYAFIHYLDDCFSSPIWQINLYENGMFDELLRYTVECCQAHSELTTSVVKATSKQ